MEPIRRHRRALSTALALLLAVESVTVVSVAAVSALAGHPSAVHDLPAAPPSGEVLAETGTANHVWEPGVAAPTASAAPSSVVAPEPFLDPRPYVHPLTPAAPAATASPTAAPTATPKPATATKTTPKPATATKTTPKPATATKTTPKASTTTTTKTASQASSATAYVGRNHVWMPSLGVNQSVSAFSCTRSAAPDNYVYRWGCAGDNNVYLLGHAWGVFKPLHDAYLNGRLVIGMKVYYADDSGQVHAYSVQWWKLTRPTTDASWAWAAQSVPSMTLQTCMGANSEYRLMVRLVQIS